MRETLFFHVGKMCKEENGKMGRTKKVQSKGKGAEQEKGNPHDVPSLAELLWQETAARQDRGFLKKKIAAVRGSNLGPIPLHPTASARAMEKKIAATRGEIEPRSHHERQGSK